MKFITALLIVSALVAVALGKPHHEEGHIGTECKYECNNASGKAICATNGDCRKHFPNECELKMYNCVNHPKKQFQQEDEEKCDDKSVPLCPA